MSIVTGIADSSSAAVAAERCTNSGDLCLRTVIGFVVALLLAGSVVLAQLPVDIRAVSGSAAIQAGTTPYVFLSTSAVLTAQIKGAPGLVWHVVCWNSDTGNAWVRLYDQTGAPAAGDGANIKVRILLPANSSHVPVSFPNGVTFATGIGIRATKAVGNTDTTALVADTSGCNVGYN